MFILFLQLLLYGTDAKIRENDNSDYDCQNGQE